MCLKIIKDLKKLLNGKNNERQRAEKAPTERQSGEVAVALPPLVFATLPLVYRPTEAVLGNLGVQILREIMEKAHITNKIITFFYLIMPGANNQHYNQNNSNTHSNNNQEYEGNRGSNEGRINNCRNNHREDNSWNRDIN